MTRSSKELTHMAQRYGDPMNSLRALVRAPSPLLTEGIVTHIDRRPVDVNLAHRQWTDYVTALAEHGWQIIETTPTPDCPDGVFIEDQVFMYGQVAVLCRSGSVERQAEQVGLAEQLAELGYQVVTIEAPGTLDGGDILKYDGQIWVGDGGPSGRSNHAGIAQLTATLQDYPVTVHTVPNTRALHLKSAVTALPDGTIIGWDPVVTDASGWSKYQAMPEEPGAHVVLLGGEHVLMAASAPQSAELLRSHGWRVTTVDISEFEKLEGCVTCLSVRLRN